MTPIQIKEYENTIYLGRAYRNNLPCPFLCGPNLPSLYCYSCKQYYSRPIFQENYKRYQWEWTPRWHPYFCHLDPKIFMRILEIELTLNDGSPSKLALLTLDTKKRTSSHAHTHFKENNKTSSTRIATLNIFDYYEETTANLNGFFSTSLHVGYCHALSAAVLSGC